MTTDNQQQAPSTVPTGSYIEWGPIFAGSVLVLGLSLILLFFGSAVGLAIVSPWSNAAVATSVIWGGSFWFLLVQLWSFALGGYIAGRMRHRWFGASETEVHFRDGAHGLLVWGLSVILSVTIGSLLVSATNRGTADAGESTSSARSITGAPMTLALDHLFRQAQPISTSSGNYDPRPEAARLLFANIRDSSLTVPDRTYLSQLVAAKTGLNQAEADTRVQTVSGQLKLTLDRLRKTTVLLGFLAAASLLVGAATAWWAAVTGGQHRDQGTIWEGLGRNQRLGSWQELVQAKRGAKA